MAIQTRIVGEFASAFGECGDRLAIAPQVRETAADPDDGICAFGIRFVIALRLRELLLSLLFDVCGERRRVERLAEKRHRLDVRRKILLRIGNLGRRRTRRAQHRHHRESLHVSDRTARAVASTSCGVFMIPKASRANGTA